MVEADSLANKATDQTITLADQIRMGLEYRVLELVMLGYKSMYDNCHFDVTWKENKFTAVLKSHMEKQVRSLSKATRRNWKIEREHYLDSDDIIYGDGDPDAASRIDIIISTWTTDYEEITFPFECKLLAEDKVHLIRLYVVKGIVDRYLTDKNYAEDSAWGGMIGYVVQGDYKTVVEKLNSHLFKQTSTTKKIFKVDNKMTSGNPLFETIHNSVHQRPTVTEPLSITHILLPFSMQKRALPMKIENKENL